jgi:hypothetical protein
VLEYDKEVDKMLRKLFMAAMVCAILSTAGCIGSDSNDYDSTRYIISSGLVDEAGNTFVAYVGERSPGDHDIHLLKIDCEGAELWEKIMFTGDDRRASILGMVRDRSGGVFVAWEVLKPENGKEGPHNFDKNILMRLDRQGEIKLDQEFYVRGMKMAADGEGGVILGWATAEDHRVLRLDDSGSTLWAHPVPSHGTGLELEAGENGESFILWRNLDNPYFVVQKLSADGQTLWGEEGMPEGVRIKHLETALPPEPKIISDGAGGAFVSWAEPTGGGMPSYVWTCRIKADGRLICDAPVRDLASTTNIYTELAPDGSGGAIVAWEDHRDGMALYAQRVSAEGEPLWQENGVSVCTDLPEVSPRFDAIGDGKGGVTVAWIDGDRDLYAQVLNDSGEKQCKEEGIKLNENVCNMPVMVSGAEQDGFIIGWCIGEEDHQPESSYVHKVDTEGTRIWGKRLGKNQ